MLVLDDVHSSLVQRSRTAIDLTIAHITLYMFDLVGTISSALDLIPQTVWVRARRSSFFTRWRHQACHGALADGRVRARSILFNGGILEAMLLELVTIVNFDRAVMTSILKASDHDVSHIIPSSEIPTVTVQPVCAQISLA